LPRPPGRRKRPRRACNRRGPAASPGKRKSKPRRRQRRGRRSEGQGWAVRHHARPGLQAPLACPPPGGSPPRLRSDLIIDYV